MSDGPTTARGRFKRRWTLGRLMILIAVLAVPLAIYIQHAQEVERQRAAALANLEHAKRRLRASLQNIKPRHQVTVPMIQEPSR